MAITNRDTKWEFKNSWFLILAFVPIANVVILFNMSARTANPKWKRIGWGVLVVSVLLLLMWYVSFQASLNTPDHLVDTPNEPMIEEFLGADYFNTYKGEKYPYTDPETGKVYESYDDTPEYREWKDAYFKWENTPEQKEIRRAQREWEDNGMLISIVSVFAYFVANIAVGFVVLADRGNYLRILASNENKMQLAGAMATSFANSSSGSRIPEQYRNQQGYAVNNQQFQANPNTGFAQQAPVNIQGNAQPVANSMYSGQASQQMAPQVPVQPQPDQHTQSMFGNAPVSGQAPVQTGVDVNTASAEIFATLPGITIIDGKKAVSYREANGGFKNIDEFYSCIQAKPHIIANIMNTVYVGAPVVKQTAPKPSNPKRTIDI